MTLLNDNYAVVQLKSAEEKTEKTMEGRISVCNCFEGKQLLFPLVAIDFG